MWHPKPWLEKSEIYHICKIQILHGKFWYLKFFFKSLTTFRCIFWISERLLRYVMMPRLHSKQFYQAVIMAHKVKTQYLHFRSHAEYFLCLGKFLKWWAEDQSSPVTKGSIYYIKHMYIQLFGMIVWKWIGNTFDIKWMYLLCFIFVDTALLLCRAELWKCSCATEI